MDELHHHLGITPRSAGCSPGARQRKAFAQCGKARLSFSREGRPPYRPTNHSWPGCHRERNPRTRRRSLLGGAGCYTLKVSKVSRVARSPFPFSIYFVPNNFPTLVVKGWGCFQLGRIGACFRRGRHRSRGRRRAGRSRRYLWLWGDPSRQSPVSDRRNRESELHGAVGSFSTSQNLDPIISQCFRRYVSCGDQPCEPFFVASPNNICHFRKSSGRVAIDRPL